MNDFVVTAVVFIVVLAIIVTIGFFIWRKIERAAAFKRRRKTFADRVDASMPQPRRGRRALTPEEAREARKAKRANRFARRRRRLRRFPR